MERTEIIKALECCTSGNSVSACMSGCPLYEKEDCECINDDTALLKYALSIIKELTAENERLSGAVKQYEEERKYHFEMSRTRIAEDKSYTVRAFAKRVKEYYSKPTYQPTKEHPIKHTQIDYLFMVIDQIAKEMLNDGCEM